MPKAYPFEPLGLPFEHCIIEACDAGAGHIESHGRLLRIGTGGDPVQGPFSVQTERFDATADTISVVTLTGHPLAGWRYWRVFQVGTNDLVIEIGAVDTYAGGKLRHPLNYAGYYLAKGDQIKVWEDDLRYILRDVQKSVDPNALQGTKPQYNVVKGAWVQIHKCPHKATS